MRLRHAGLSAHTGKVGGKIDDISCIGRRALCQLVDGGTCREHGLLQSETAFLTEDIGKFTYLIDSTLTKVVAKSHINFVRGFDKVFDILFRLFAKSSCGTSQFVELFTTGPSVHLLEVLVHQPHLFICLICIFANIGHCVLHLSISCSSLTDGDGKAGKGTNSLCKETPIGIEEPGDFRPDAAGVF